MKRWAAALVFVCTVSAFGAAKGPDVNYKDSKLSVDADSIPLARLLQLIDGATGMKSKVPADLANRTVSVRFADLNLRDGVRKMFEGQPFDYVFVEGRSIIVTAASQKVGSPEPAPAYNSPVQPPQPPQAEDGARDSFVLEGPAGFPPVPPQPVQPGQPATNQQPATIQTPFGPMVNPRAQQPQPGVPPQPGAVTAPPQNPLFPQTAQPATAPQPTPPFGATAPFSTPNTPNAPNAAPNNPNNNLFGSTPIFGTPGNPQR